MWHGCMKLQINNQGKEFANELSNSLRYETRIEQYISLSYHPQSNDLCERQDRTESFLARIPVIGHTLSKELYLYIG